MLLAGLETGSTVLDTAVGPSSLPPGECSVCCSSRDSCAWDVDDGDGTVVMFVDAGLISSCFLYVESN